MRKAGSLIAATQRYRLSSYPNRSKIQGEAYVVIAVARASRLIVGEWVTPVFDALGMQAMADRLPEAGR